MEISNAQAMVGILISLTIFCFTVRHAILTNRAAAAGNGIPARRIALNSLRRAFSPPATHVERICRSSGGASEIRVLAITQDRSCRERLKSLADFYGWDLLLSNSCSGAASLPEAQAYPVVVCDNDSQELHWRDAFEVLLASRRSRCIILCSKKDSDHLWQEVIRGGGYDVVEKPLREEQIVRTIQFAWTYWKTTGIRPLIKADGARPLTAGTGI
jgi:hypothetical protein